MAGSSNSWSGDVAGKEVFLDQEGAVLELVLDALRGYARPRALSADLESALAHTLDYFGGIQWGSIPHPAQLRINASWFESKILAKFEKSMCEHWLRTIQQWLGMSSLGKVVFSSRKDGDVSNFHSKCDSLAASVILIRSGNYLFGGYASCSWEGVEEYKEAENCFIFSLTGPFSDEPVKFDCLKPEFAVFCDPNFGPAFGLGRDLVVWYAQRGGCYNNFPQSYGPDTTSKGCAFFTGSRRFVLDEMEVFMVNLSSPSLRDSL
jgi:hypothetical protein